MASPRMRIIVVAAIIASIIFLLFGTLNSGVTPDHISDYASKVVAKVRPGATGEKLAYMTFLTGTMANASDPDPNNDNYFVATRLLGYQLMHDPSTKTRKNIPFVVLVTDDIPQTKLSLLKKDGATIIKVDFLHGPDWIIGEMPQWRDLMTKLRAWQLTQYSRIAFLDGDMILNRCMDDLFLDLATLPTTTDFSIDSPSDEAPPPETYLLATVAEVNPFHNYPPSASRNDYKDPTYFNAGFFIMSPSPQLFTHFTSIMEIKDRFDPRYVEQNLLNYVFRQDGRMPWQHMDTSWNIRFPSLGDKEGGVASLHDKWWNAHMDGGLQPFYTAARWRMEGFYEAMHRES